MRRLIKYITMSGRDRAQHTPSHISILLLLLFHSFYIFHTTEAAPHPNPAAQTDEDFRRNYAVEYGAPLITPLMEYVTLEVSTNYTIRCEANESTVWIIAHNTLEHEVKTFDTLDPQRPHGSVLYLYDITNMNVGSYYCIKESSLKKALDDMSDQELVELVNNNLASAIYIYVNDPENLLAPLDSPLITAYQYQDTVIPCKPSMPSIEVLLTTPHGETFSSESTGRYDPQRGFVVEIRGITDSGSYMCRPKVPALQNEEEETTFEIHFVGNEPINQLDKTTTAQVTTITTINRSMNKPATTTPIKKLKPKRRTNSATSTVTNNILNVTNRIVDVITTGTPISNKLNGGNGKLDVGGVSTDVGVDVGVDKLDVLVDANVGVGDGNNSINITENIGDGNNSASEIIDNGINGVGNESDVNVDGDVIVGEDDDEGRYAADITRSGDIFDRLPLTTTFDYLNYKITSTTERNDDEFNSIDNDIDIDVSVDTSNDNVALLGSTRATLARTTHLGGVTRRSFVRRAAAARTTRSHRSYSNHHSSTPRSSTKYIEKPNITSNSRGHVYEGDSFSLNCYVKIAFDVNYATQWNTPTTIDENRMKKTPPRFINNTDTHNLGQSILTINNAQKTDSGLYECIATDHSNNIGRNTYLMTVLKRGEGYINISEPSGYYKIISNANKKVQINVKYRGYPIPTLTWYKPDKTQIHPSKKYLINTTDTSITLQILNAQLEDSGEYVIRAKNELITKELQFNVSINDEPKVFVEDVYVQEGEEAHVVCKVLSYPPAIITWVFSPCSISPRWPSCDKRFDQTFNSSRNARPGERGIEYYHDLYFTPQQPGIAHCLAVNKKGHSDGKGHVLIGDISDNITIYGIDENKKIARGDEVIVTCAALSYYFTDELNWYKEDELVTESDDIEISSSNSNYSYKKILKFKHIDGHDRGSYECRGRYANDYDKHESKYTNIFVHEPLTPKMLYTNLDPNTKLERKLGDALELECKSEAIPAANVNWYKDDVSVSANNNVAIMEEGTKLVIQYIKPEDEGVYKCVAVNRLGAVESSSTVKITNLPGLRLGWILGILFFFLILIILVIYLFVRVKRERKLLDELKAAGLANFEEGAVEHINPALTLDEQADLLPYDRGFEFPREKLKLGKQLGAGAFGVVLKAHAEGIKPEEKESVVAVKMVKRTADNEVMRALVSELKIMVHLGQHLNVVNLLGAVTKNIAKRELMVIVEYCRYGNVQNFLLRNRKRFINQINTETDKIDATITTQRFSDNFELNRNSDNDPRSGTRAGRPNSTGYLRQSDLYEGHVDSCATEQTVMTTIPEDEDNVLSNNSVQPAWRSNYKPDSTEAMTITTTDLVSWAFQVARGMDYLSSRKVLHGDLAARNILLCEDNVVKICDFGLARSMYKSDNYKKQGEAPLPIKWLALESLSDHIFSTYTDVWSFGIVLWEFFSLAKVPYPGMDPNQSLYMKLKDGYRMEKPPFANDELYDIMLECWSTNPESRPLFNLLEKRFARMLGDDVTNHYVDLNEIYMRANNEYLRRNPTDYLSLMGSPDEMAPAPPRYVNGHILPEIRIEPSSSDDYLQMSTETGTTIFSPTRPKDRDHTSDEPNTTTTTSFTFPETAAPSAAEHHSPTLMNNMDSPVNKHRKKELIQPEEIPMLHGTHHTSDGEQSPEQARKFADILQQSRPTPTPSPRHHIAETELTGGDNYVNVKSPRKQANNNGARTADAFSNPSYQMLKTVSKGVGDN